MFHRLYGGVRLRDRKRAANQQKTTAPERAPQYVVLPMEMQAGAPCSPIVSQGEHVLMGQKIAAPVGSGVPIHASVSGTVAAIEPRPHPNGTSILSVVIENDFQDTPAPALEHKADPENLTGWEIAGLTTEAGIPIGTRLKEAIGKADTLIINATESEPYVTADHRLMLEDGERILSGVEILMRALTLKSALIAVEGNKMDAIEHLRSLLPTESGIRVIVLKARYPHSTEQQLIQALTGRQIPSGGTCVDARCAVFQVSDAAAIHDAVVLGRPLTHRIVTVSGGAVRQPHNLRLPIGTPLSILPEECGGLAQECVRVILGGPMTGTAQRDLEAPVIKSTNALLLLTRRECAPGPAKSSPCIRCGRCIKACSMNLTPLFLDQYRRKGRISELEQLHLMDCTECGCCTYVCPAHIPLTQSIRTAKEELLRQRETSQKEAE